MTWFAVRTAPGAQMPQRIYSTNRGEGPRIIVSLDPNVSAIERALTDAGISHWMPAEKRLIRDRLRPYIWKSRRFALMVGYIFVQDPDWYALSEAPGVIGAVACQGVPLPIAMVDILMVRTMEAEAEAEFDRQQRNLRSAIRKKARHNPHYRRLVEQLDIAGTISIPIVEMAA